MTQKDREATNEFATKVRERLANQLAALKLFGSKARGDDTPESDIDVLVEVNLKYDVYISRRVIEQAVFEDPLWKETPFIQHLGREGVPL